MRLLALIIIVALTATLQADILHLRDGSRHYGEVVAENNREVAFRTVTPDGSASVVHTFATELVAHGPQPQRPSGKEE